ncbi:G protein coupled receptor bride of sevenless [Lycorma delicatula]|uniref:G protein coupled receptor bride of sevenless n=1 Tax=Lycorma delicatula TaxID=130591 RepID=UPI003F51814F
MRVKLEAICLLVLITKVHTSCNDSQAIFKVPGDAYLTGIFNGHSGENCSTPVTFGIQQMAASIAVIKTFQDISFLPGIKIGISLYDGCSSALMSQKAVVTATVEDDCTDSVSLGILSSPEIYQSLQGITSTLSLPVITTSNPYHIPFLFDITTSLLVSLGWSVIDLILASDSLLLDSFDELATYNLLCVHKKKLLSELRDISLDGTVLLIADGIEFDKVLNEKGISINDNACLLFIPLNGELTIQPSLLSRESYVILPSFMNNLYDFVSNSTGDNSTNNGSELPLIEEVQSPVFIQMATDILQIATLFKSSLAANCPDALQGGGICKDFILTKSRIVTQPALQSGKLSALILKLLKIEEEDFELFKVVKQNLSEEFGYSRTGSYKLSKGEWKLMLENENKTKLQLCRNIALGNKSIGMDCSHCSNFITYSKKFEKMREKEGFWESVEWKSEAWVAAILTISAVGILCVMAVATFIAIRICKQDILEGNPTITFLLLISVTFTYISCLPFAFIVLDGHTYYSELFCNLRIFGTSLSYSLIFSIMLARCFMIASCDQDGGFMSHINGYLQSVVCFFIIAVQIALSIQFGAMNWKFLSTDECISMTKGYLFISMLCYNMFLLILLIFTSPFVMKSKRNYHEGSFFAVASLLCVLAWCGWITAFFLLPDKWHDMIITCGLCGTATIIVVTVFIPRTYLMMTGIVRDHLASNLPSLAYASSNSVIDVNYRSTQALYDSVNPVSTPKGQLNPNFYSDRPGTPSTSKMDSIQRAEHRVPENTYERYDTPTSPLNVTRF